ncbi:MULTISPECIES: class I SAM-dependent methyltransferase [unclassified Streptomyces]|uniref:class I SAM-dependent DNA methyltransferase n=1 Tax=unclassified Streptomyces TaxID=2593676 RepID=UPI002366C474|nr:MULTISPECIES: class I SAM-dependent methyltransferase [unclassified Streptomyces]MDF3142578.1 class I SAM-dependent methyltransferase [Streptomyces sp. T21Q-yed]WDF40780.1 class I SAM-dependent methyltransferase [Streptomyces sp. T12]
MRPVTADFLQATRASYDAIAPAYADRFSDWPADSTPLDRSLVTAFAELAREHAPAPVADLGSGPGSVTAHLHTLGLPVFGVDLSPRMVGLARRAYPELRFHVGSMTSLDLPDETLGGIVALYSIIHVPDDHLPATFAEFHRVLVPGAPVLLAFQSGAHEDHLHLSERFGQEIALDYYWRIPDTVIDQLTAAGLRLYARIVREAEGEEKRPRAFLLAEKPSAQA